MTGKIRREERELSAVTEWVVRAIIQTAAAETGKSRDVTEKKMAEVTAHRDVAGKTEEEEMDFLSIAGRSVVRMQEGKEQKCQVVRRWKNYGKIAVS